MKPDCLVQPQIPTTGLLCTGDQIELHWPEAQELDAITLLRNRPAIRKWFTDPRPRDLDANRHWLQSGMQRPQEALLSIRWRQDQRFLGAVGWTDWQPAAGTAMFGRVMIVIEALQACQAQTGAEYVGVTLDAALSLRNFAFEQMQLNCGFTYCLAGNALALRLNRQIGMQETGHHQRQRPDGSLIDTVEMQMTRLDWLRLKGLEQA